MPVSRALTIARPLLISKPFLILVSVCAVISSPGAVSAAPKSKKITYEQAFQRCKAFIDKEKGGLAHGTTNENTRMARGAACMRKFGYRI